MNNTSVEQLAEKLGSGAMQGLERWLDQQLQEKSVSRDEYREILSRLEILEKGQDGLRDGLINLTSDVALLRAEMNRRIDRMQRWTVGMIATAGEVVAVLIAIFKFIGQ